MGACSKVGVNQINTVNYIGGIEFTIQRIQ